MLYAIIDIGSSIIKYKIFEYNNDIIEPVLIHDESTGLISYRKDNKLTEKGITVLLNTLQEFQNYSKKFNVDKDIYVATASLRNLDNQKEVLDIIKKELNVDIKVLTGDEEASYSFKSINNLNVPTDEGILIDIGGGSSEITVFEDKNRILEQKSIPIGVLIIYYEYVSLIYPTNEEQKIIIQETLNRIEKLGIEDYDKEYLYGIGKSFVVIKKLFEHMNIKEDQSDILTIEQVDSVLETLSSNTKEKFKPLLQVDSERIHTIVPCLLIVKALSVKFGIKKIAVCNVTLQDGIIYSMLKE